MKKIIAMLLCILMVSVCALTACNNGTTPNESKAAESNAASNPASTDESASTSTSEWTDGIVGYLGNGKWGREMPEFKWTDKETFNILVYSNEQETTYFSEEIEPNLYTTTDSTLTEAVEARNNYIFDKYGVEIKAVLCKNVYETLTQQLAAASPDNADAAMPFLTYCTTLAQAGQLYDLREFEEDGYLDLSMPWWEANATNSFSIADKVYFSISDMSIMQKIVSTCIMFNKVIMTEKYPNINLYDEVNNKTWTLDRMVSLAKDCANDSDGEDGMTWTDDWGISGAHGDAAMMYLSSGARLVTKNADDEPALSLGVDERSINIAQKVLTTLEDNTWVIHADDLDGDKWVKSLQIFGENRALFRTSAFSAVKKVRAYDNCSFGLIPYPLIDETQDNYYTPCSAKYAYGIVIPLSAPDPEYSAFMLDVISAASRGDSSTGITKAYQEVILKGRDLDTESGEMLDKYIFKNIVYDLGIIYGFGIDTVLSSLMASSSTDIVSSLATQQGTIETKIEEIIDSYKNRM